jgi:hypothetical protein
MFLGIDHLVIAVADPGHAALQLERDLGLAANGGGRLDALGTFNRLVWLGDSYLELIGVVDRARAEASWIGTPTLRALDAGGGLATWAIATDAIDSDVAALRAAGSDVGVPISGERRRPDGGVVRWRLATPRRLGPAEPPFLIEHDAAAVEWTPAERVARQAQDHPIGGRVWLEALELRVDDVTVTIRQFLRASGLRFRPSLSGGGSRDAQVGRQTVRLRPTRGGAESAVIHLVASEAGEERTSSILGCRWIVRPAR